MGAVIDEWRKAFCAPFSGWDFSSIGVRDDPLPWSYKEIARTHLRSAVSTLDIGTGGGERLAELVPEWPELVVATEDWPPNVPVAAGRLSPLGAVVVTADSSGLAPQPFRSGTFDVVLARHSAVDVAEVARILTPAGVLVTQQVDPDNLDDLRTRFGMEASPPDFVDMSPEAAEVADLAVINHRRWHGRMHVQDVTALLSYIRAVPWVLPDFDFDVHLPILHEIDQQEGPISFGISRSLLVASRATRP